MAEYRRAMGVVTDEILAWASGEIDNGTIYGNGDHGAGFEVKLCLHQVGEVSWVFGGNVE